MEGILQKISELANRRVEPQIKDIQSKPGDMLKVPLSGDRYIMIPKDFNDSEANYFTKWYEMWKVLHGQE